MRFTSKSLVPAVRRVLRPTVAPLGNPIPSTQRTSPGLIYEPVSGFLISRWAFRKDDCACVHGRVGIADIGPVPENPIVVAVRAVCNGKRSAGLKGRDAANLPPAQRIFRPARARTRNCPQVSDCQTLWPVEHPEDDQVSIEFSGFIHEHPMTAIAVVLISSIVLETTTNMENNRLWEDGTYKCESWQSISE